MDSTYLTAMRTGIAGALAADVLARPDADTVAVIGGGVQGTFQLRALAMRRIRRVSVYDTAPGRATACAGQMAPELGLPVDVADSVSDAVRAAGVVLAATWATTPFLLPGMLGAGTHMTTLGPDEPGKAEVSADVIRTSVFVCDDRQLAVDLGALRASVLARRGSPQSWATCSPARIPDGSRLNRPRSTAAWALRFRMRLLHGRCTRRQSPAVQAGGSTIWSD